MDHPRIDDEQILDRYLAGRLSADDEASFEEHLFECEACLEKVQWGEELRRGLRAVAAEDAARAAASVGLAAWLRRRPARLAGLAGLALVVLALSAVVAWQQAQLDRVRERGAGFTEPVGDLLVVPLGVVRDAGAETEVRVDAERGAVLLSLELPRADGGRYRVTLRDAAGTVRWRGDELEPDLYDSLLVALPPSFLAPGGYRVEVEALTPSGAEPAFETSFRVAAGS